jgi:alkanesulfonate monooxygenase SsuD/methylene tetrahydromethanopterin reductase-like flavin-dependent oxidoreductase (luciferase family)
MEIGIGLPSTIPGVEGREITGWARRAEERGFSTLGTIDRLVYANYEPLVALAAAAAVTERIRLTTDILLVPFRVNAALLAKQAATLDRLSAGRLVLGVAPGSREDDYDASGVPFSGRGRRFDEMLEQMRRVWAGEAGIGPSSNGGPRVLVGGRADVAFRRAARWDGWTMGGGAPDDFAAGLEKLRTAWSEQGRDGEPRAVALCYYALGDDPEAKAAAYLKDYYAYLGEHADAVASSAATDAETCREYAQGFEAAGADELIVFPCSTKVEQVDLLADAVL